MGKALNKRDFLKLLAALPPSIYFSKPFRHPDLLLQNPDAKNVLIIVFDTLSAKNISLYGYPRETMPNLARIAEKGTVYHNHFAGGNWTVPGTASLLTGTYPWTHRAFNDEYRTILEGRERNNIFHFFDQYYRIGYSHNSNLYPFFDQFSPDLEQIKSRKDLFISNVLALHELFPHDNDIAPISWDRMMTEAEKGYTYSLFFAPFYQRYSQKIVDDLRDDFPRGVPRTGADNYFLLEDGMNWLMSQAGTFPRPFLGYFHFLPPHRPYNPRREFVNVFSNDYYVEKPKPGLYAGNEGKPPNLRYQGVQRQFYDEFILYADSELGRLYDSLEQSGILENTWLIFTSDHGEMCERGVFGHRTPVLYQPVIHIPLVILEPGQTKRQDIFTPTSAVDVLPTLLKITGQEIPGWAEGTVLPPFADTAPNPERNLYALEATNSEAHGVLNPATAMLVKDRYKLTYYFGYGQLKKTGPLFELYDLENDPEELNNIHDVNSEISQELQNEMLAKIEEVDKPYRNG